MATWNSRGLRGSLLEEMINRTNEKYRQKKLALIQKIPTPSPRYEPAFHGSDHILEPFKNRA